MKIARLDREDSVEVMKRGRSLHCPLFRVKYLPNSSNTHKIAIVAAKKEEKTAVGRNRIKRRLRAALLKVLGTCSEGVDIMIFAKKTSQTSPFSTIVQEMEKILESI